MLEGKWCGFDCDADSAGYPIGVSEVWAARRRLFERVYKEAPAAVVVFVREGREVEVAKAIGEMLNQSTESASST